jgi:hypothetical protein
MLLVLIPTSTTRQCYISAGVGVLLPVVDESWSLASRDMLCDIFV